MTKNLSVILHCSCSTVLAGKKQVASLTVHAELECTTCPQRLQPSAAPTPALESFARTWAWLWLMLGLAKI